MTQKTTDMPADGAESPAMQTRAASAREGLAAFFAFRSSGAVFALAPAYVDEVAASVFVHRIPHRAGSAVEGISNFNGEIIPVVNAAAAFGINGGGQKSQNTVLCRVNGERIAFKADSVEGIIRVKNSALKDGGDSPLAAKTIELKAETARLIDAELLAEAIARRSI